MSPSVLLRLRACPALYVAVCFAAGIASSDALRWISFPAWAAAASAGLLVIAALWWRTRRRLVSLYPLGRALAVAVVAASAGGAACAMSRMLPPGHISFADAPLGLNLVEVTGRVVGTPVPYATGVRFDVQVQAVSRGGPSHAATGIVRVRLPDEHGAGAGRARMDAGDRVQVVGRLRRVQSKRNPADFDYEGYLEHRGIYHVLYAASSLYAAVVQKSKAPVDRLVARTRRYVEEWLRHQIPSASSRALIQALLLGDRHAIDEQTMGDFRRTGLAHLLAVSGLHVLLVGMVLYRLLVPLLSRLGLPWRSTQLLRAGVTLLVLLLYVLLTGSGPSAVRAAVMAAVLMGADVLQRAANVLNSLGVAALVLLSTRPGFLFDVGFQLSFTAVAAIAVLYPVLKRCLPDPWFGHPLARYSLSSALVSIAASLGTAPLLLYHFGEVSVAGPLLNLVAIPLTMSLLAASVASVVFYPLLPVLAGMYGEAADALAHALLFTAGMGRHLLGWAVVDGYLLDGWLFVMLAAAVGVAARWPLPRNTLKLVLGMLLAVNVVLWTRVLSDPGPRLDVLFFDVGHGDAALISTPGGRHLLVDTGGRDAWQDDAVRTILPHLRHDGIRALDAVVVTHPHGDHLGGLSSLLRDIPIHMVIHNGDISSSALFDETRQVLDSLGIPRRTVQAGDTLRIDEDIHIAVLFPTPAAVQSADPNHGSIVLRIVYGQTSFLLMGDAGVEAEREIMRRYPHLLPASAIKVGHHGSSTSSGEAFVQAVTAGESSAPLAVISVGTSSGYGLPDAEIIERWQHHGAAVHITAEDGALWLRSDGRHVEVVPWR